LFDGPLSFELAECSVFFKDPCRPDEFLARPPGLWRPLASFGSFSHFNLLPM
jgi:hypothetical protein